MDIKRFKKLIVNTSVMLDKHPELRTGQALVNELTELDGVHDSFYGKTNEIDPYYDERNVKEFLEFLVLKFEGKNKIEANFLSMGFPVKHLSSLKTVCKPT